MAEEEIPELDRLEDRVIAAFRDAYPEVPALKLEHMARNFTQVVQGIINIGGRVGCGDEVAHMDVANGLVYWCMANTYLDEIRKGEQGAAPGAIRSPRIGDDEMKKLLNECVARVADWLIGLEILREDPELYRRFVAGAAALGASDWERNRGNLHY